MTLAHKCPFGEEVQLPSWWRPGELQSYGLSPAKSGKHAVKSHHRNIPLAVTSCRRENWLISAQKTAGERPGPELRSLISGGIVCNTTTNDLSQAGDEIWRRKSWENGSRVMGEFLLVPGAPANIYWQPSG